MNDLVPDDPSDRSQVPGGLSAANLHAVIEKATKSTKVIAGAKRGIFDLNKDDVDNFFHLIDQRINE